MLKIQSPFNLMPYDFSIFRIIGGDLPPRDKIGSRIETLKFILENEKEFFRTHKGWILNTIPDMDYRREICNLLNQYKAYFIVLPMFRKGYESASTKEEKIVHAIPINKARNLAITHGIKIARFTAILDGDCFIDEETWEKTTKFIKKDQTTNFYRHYAMPHTRSTIDHVMNSNEPLGPLAEPMPLFRNDSEIRFNENIPFGKGDKLDLLFKLGYSQRPFENHRIVNPGICKTIGHVHHLATGDELTETDLKERVRLRNISIDTLLEKLDNTIPSYRRPNEYWKQIQGWFDYQGLYSQFMYEAKDGDIFVEVGSWMGASTCYLATESKTREKNIKIYAVDTWEGSIGDEGHKNIIRNLDTSLYSKFLENMKRGGVDHIISPIKKTSEEASKMFENESVDVVFIDASHKYEDVKKDINFWYPKVKKGGIISGHDYVPGHPESDIGVVKAVNEFFKCKDLEIGPAGRTWMHRKK